MAGYLLFRLWEHLTTPPRILKKDKPFIDPNRKIKAFSSETCTLSLPSTKPPDIRFSMSGNSIYGIPVTSSHPPPFFLISRPPPAVRSYILGPDWESQLTHEPRPGDSPEYSQYPQGYIPQPDDALDEANHCLRMKRCGAEIRQSYHDTRYRDLSQRQIFGWPVTSGVWILCWPNVLFEEVNLEDLSNYLERKRCEDKRMQVVSELNEQLNMDGFCEVLKGHGAVFYEVLANCREVVELGLEEA